MHAYQLSEPKTIEDSVLTSLTPRVRRLLAVRGITSDTEADIFLHPDWERDIHDPFLMKDMERVVLRIEQAVLNDETIALWSDYDMDGIPGAVVLHDYFDAIGYKKVIHYTPHRNKEGFGLNTEGIDELAKQGVTLVVTIDCGITDTTQVAHANKKGVDVIVTDHHLPPKVPPKAYAILNPKQKGCKYPEKMLCGAGVAFKLVQGLLAHTKKHETLPALNEGWEKWLLDMVGMATVADMVPLVGENRTLAYYGHVVLRKSRRPGLQALLQKARANQRHLTEDDVSFTIAPRINAASRMGHAKDAFALLTSKDATQAGVLATELERINKERKTIVATMKRGIHRTLKKQQHDKPVLVLGNPEWKPSLLGLVAGSLADDLEKPVFLWGREEGNSIKGSCRSYGGVHVYDLMKEAKENFISYGGHAYSGGFSASHEQVHTLEEALIEAFEKKSTHIEKAVKQYDDTLSLEEVTWDTYREIAQLAPFGEGNKKPVFKIHDARIDTVRSFGKGKEHFELGLVNEYGKTVKVIAFFSDPSSFTTLLEPNERVSLVVHLEASYFMGRSEVRLRLVDVL